MEKNMDTIYFDSWKHDSLRPCVPGKTLDRETAKRCVAEAIDRGEIPRLFFPEDTTGAEIEEFALLARSRGKTLASY
jgi:hypothetical protein